MIDRIGNLHYTEYMFMVCGPNWPGPSERDRAYGTNTRPTHILKKSLKMGMGDEYYKKGTLAHIATSNYIKSGVCVYDDTANGNGITRTLYKGYKTTPRIIFVDECGNILYVRLKSGEVQDRSLAAYDRPHNWNKYFRKLQNHE